MESVERAFRSAEPCAVKVFVVANVCIPSHKPPRKNRRRNKPTREGHVCFEMLFKKERRNPPLLLMRYRLTVAHFSKKRFFYKFF